MTGLIRESPNEFGNRPQISGWFRFDLARQDFVGRVPTLSGPGLPDMRGITELYRIAGVIQRLRRSPGKVRAKSIVHARARVHDLVNDREKWR